LAQRVPVHPAYFRQLDFRGQFFTAFIPAAPDQLPQPMADLQVLGHGIRGVNDSHERFLSHPLLNSAEGTSLQGANVFQRARPAVI